MRAPRSLLLILGGTALVVGAVLAFATYSRPIVVKSVLGEGGQRLMSEDVYEAMRSGRFQCERPITAAWATDDGGGWFNYSPNSGAVFAPSMTSKCVSSARWRLGGGVLLMLGGVVSLVVWTRQTRLGVSASSPPPGAGSSDPSPGGPSPS